jgi:L-alanine-DL-glutamate epimerase-like enolase superfamily enzyme
VDGVYGAYYVMKHIAEQHLVSKNPLDVHRLQEDMRRGGLFKGAQAGMYVCVMSALETALWDLAGKAFGLPVYRLLGGKFRDKIRVYCDTAGSRLEPAEMGRRAKEDVEKYGFTAVKFDIDDAGDPRKLDRYNWSVGLAELERMVAQIAAVWAAVGPTSTSAWTATAASTSSPPTRSRRRWSPSTSCGSRSPCPPSSRRPTPASGRRRPPPSAAGRTGTSPTASAARSRSAPAT